MGIAITRGKRIDQRAKRRSIAQQWCDVAKLHARLRPIGNRTDMTLKEACIHDAISQESELEHKKNCDRGNHR